MSQEVNDENIFALIDLLLYTYFVIVKLIISIMAKIIAIVISFISYIYSKHKILHLIR